MKLFKSLIILSLLTTIFISSATISDFSLKMIDGSVFKISDHIGKKIILIDFWAIWCKPCMKFLKKLDKISMEFKQKLLVISISTDDSSSFSKVGSYIKSRRYKFPVLLDPDSSVGRIYNPAGKVPFTMIINKAGKIVYTHIGYIPGYENEIRKEIKKLIHE